MKRFNQTIAALVLTSLLTVTVNAQKTEPVFRVAKFKADKQCAISYTFDDGLEEHYTLVYPKFEALGFKGTFWVNGHTINEGYNGPVNNSARTSWEQLKAMADHGHEISNHGWSHKNLTRCTPDEVQMEIDRNDSIIATKIGERPVTFCYPFNAKNDEVVRMASANRVGTRTSQFSMGGKSTPENLSQRVETLMETADWGVAMIHGITNGYDAFGDADILWNHLDMVKAMEDSIWVGTFRDVAAYVAERDAIGLNVDRNGNRFTVVPTLALDKNLFDRPLTMVVDLRGIRKLKAKQNGKLLSVAITADKASFDFDPYGGAIYVRVY